MFRERLKILLFFLPVLLLGLVPVKPLWAQEEAAITTEEGGQSGLPLPRFASLASNEANLRTGPGLKYPITWVLVRESMPVEIIREFGAWREIRIIDGDEGWVHQSLLSGDRTAMVHPYLRRVYEDSSTESRPLAEVEPNVIVGVDECIAGWCRVDILNYDGWMEKSGLWGVYGYEKFEKD